MTIACPALPIACLFAMTLALTGCASGVIGPDFVSPAAPDVDYTADPLPSRTASANAAGAEAQYFQVGANVPGRWWEQFGSSELNALVEAALTANPGLQSAQQSLVQAQENYAATQASRLLPSATIPGVQAAAGSSIQNPNAGPFSVTTIGNLSVSYSIDICCGSARERESSEAGLLRQEVALEASYISLTANVVNAVINLALTEERRAATQEVLTLQRELAGIADQRLALGDISASDAASQEAQAISTEASLVSLDRELSQQRNQLAIYLGRFPSEMPQIDIDLDDIRLPTNIPVSLPSTLITQRPDIVQATYNLQAATANVGVTMADMLPQITISGNFTPVGLAWNLVGSVMQAAVNVGANIHRTNAAEAALQASAETYQSTVISAFVDVANSLDAITADARLMELEVQAEAASRRSLELAQQEYQLGTVAYSTVLSAQQSYRSAVTSLLSARAARLSDMVALYVALGGGWWNTDAPVVAAN